MNICNDGQRSDPGCIGALESVELPSLPSHTQWGIVLLVADRRKPISLPLLTQTYVPDERKAGLRRRLQRVQGQVGGIGRMLDENRPCMDILVQVTAAQEALRGFSRIMVLNYLEKCGTEALREGRQHDVYDDLMKVIFKLAR